MVVEGSNDETHFSGFSVVGSTDTGTDMKKSSAKASEAKPGLERVRQPDWSRQRAESPLTLQLCASMASCLMRMASLSLD